MVKLEKLVFGNVLSLQYNHIEQIPATHETGKRIAVFPTSLRDYSHNPLNNRIMYEMKMELETIPENMAKYDFGNGRMLH